MPIRLLIVDDQPEFVDRIRRELKQEPGVQVVGVDPHAPCKDAWGLLARDTDRHSLFLIVDLHMQDHTSGMRSDQAGALFIQQLVEKGYFPGDELRDHVVLCSNYPDVETTEVAARLGIRAVEKVSLADTLRGELVAHFLEVATRRTRRRGRRQREGDALRATARWCFRDPTIRREFAGRFVAASRKTIWGAGDDAEAATRAAVTNRDRPDEPFILVAIPPRLEIDPAELPPAISSASTRAGGD